MDQRHEPEPGKIARSRGGSRLYAWCVAAGTVLVAGLLLWPLTVNTFRSTAGFQLSYDPTSGLEKASLNRLVINAMQEATSRDGIATVIRDMHQPVTSHLLLAASSEQIRKATTIRARPGRFANSVDYIVTMTGDGTPDEIEFINSLVVRINSRLERQIGCESVNAVVARLSGDFANYHTGVLNQTSDRITSAIDSINATRNDIQIINNDLANVLEAPPSGEVFGRPAFRGGPSELEQLKGERERLLAQPSMTVYHAEVTAVQRRIEALTGTQSDNTSASGGGDFQFQGTTGGVVRNRFATPSTQSAGSNPSAGTAPAFNVSIATIVDEIGRIDLSEPGQELQALNESLAESRESSTKILNRITSHSRGALAAASPVSMTGIHKATFSQPVGGVPAGRIFLWMCVAAGLFGAAVAVTFDPKTRKRRFRSLAQLQQRLGVPVVGVVRSRPLVETSTSFRGKTAANVVRLCEWSLLAIALLLVVAVFCNSQVASAFLANPFHGVTQTVWMLTSHG